MWKEPKRQNKYIPTAIMFTEKRKVICLIKKCYINIAPHDTRLRSVMDVLLRPHLSVKSARARTHVWCGPDGRAHLKSSPGNFLADGRTEDGPTITLARRPARPRPLIRLLRPLSMEWAIRSGPTPRASGLPGFQCDDWNLHHRETCQDRSEPFLPSFLLLTCRASPLSPMLFLFDEVGEGEGPGPSSPADAPSEPHA